jgi:hypothetical protein
MADVPLHFVPVHVLAAEMPLHVAVPATEILIETFRRRARKRRRPVNQLGC